VEAAVRSLSEESLKMEAQAFTFASSPFAPLAIGFFEAAGGVIGSAKGLPPTLD
jgi:hypothetical protein